MNRIFLGRWQHWLALAALCVAGWLGGRARLHVTDFNLFVGLVVLATVATLVVVFATSRPDERVTRDPILEDDRQDDAAEVRAEQHAR